MVIIAVAQYTSRQYYTLAADCDVTLSVGWTGQCRDNAVAESFFASSKGECIEQQSWPTQARARRAVVDYIAWYNGTRPTPPRLPHPNRIRNSHRPRSDHLAEVACQVISPVRQTGHPRACGRGCYGEPGVFPTVIYQAS